MKLKLLTVGVPRAHYLLEGEAEYIKRLKRYCKISVESVDGNKMSERCDEAKIKEEEAQRLLKRISNLDHVILFDVEGKRVSSTGLSEKFIHYQSKGRKNVVFIIGGPIGVSQSLKDRADEQISLSDMTFPHEICRLIVLEQIYRAFTIIKGEKYHKG